MILAVFLLNALIGGTNPAFVKAALAEFPPITLVFLRSLLAALVTLPLIYSQWSKIKTFSDKKLLFISSLLFAGNWLFFSIGLQFSTIIMSQIIYMMTPLIVAILGYFFLKEILSKNQILGLILAILGMSILIYGSIKSQDIFSFGTPLGNFILIIAKICWALYLVTSRKVSKSYSPLTILFFNFITATLVALLIIPFELSIRQFDLTNVSATGLFSLLALALISSVLVFFLYQWLIKHTSAFIPSLLSYPVALVAGIIGIIFFGEKLTVNLILGGALIMLGVFLATTYQYAKKLMSNIWTYQ